MSLTCPPSIRESNRRPGRLRGSRGSPRPVARRGRPHPVETCGGHSGHHGVHGRRSAPGRPVDGRDVRGWRPTPASGHGRWLEREIDAVKVEHLVFFVEEPSTERFLTGFLSRFLSEDQFRIHAFRGKSASEKNLERRLRGYARWLREFALTRTARAVFRSFGICFHRSFHRSWTPLPNKLPWSGPARPSERPAQPTSDAPTAGGGRWGR